MARTLEELCDAIDDEASAVRPRMPTIKRLVEQIRQLTKPSDPGSVWSRMGKQAAVEKSKGSPERQALAELVACKDLKERFLALEDAKDGPLFEQLKADYHRRQPLAWAIARELLK